MTITGDMDYVRMGGTHLMSIDQWGDIRWKTMRDAFGGSPNLVHAAADAPDITRVTDMSGMFRGASSVGDLSGWDVSNVTDMSGMFASVRSFGGDISGWGVSSVTDMSGMFVRSSFNGDISGWGVSNVRDMSGMFEGSASFNQDISEWGVSSVTNMNRMFYDSTTFNQDISEWDVSNVPYTNGMFGFTSSFNQPIGSWNVSGVTDISAMFLGAASFNQDISGWDVSSVTNMAGTFAHTGSFNQPLNGWDVSSVTNMGEIFKQARAFNQSLNSWDVSRVTDMSKMFERTASFNGDITEWDVSSVTNMDSMFEGAASFNRDISSWNISSVTTMRDMFRDTGAFNQSIGSWDISGKSAHHILIGASSFQQNLGNWYIQLDDLTVTDSDPVVGHLVTPIGWTTVGYFFLPEPEGWSTGKYSVVHPADGQFFVDPGTRYLLPDGTPLVLAEDYVLRVGIALMLNSTHDLTPGTTYNVTIQVDCRCLTVGEHIKQVPVFYDGLMPNRQPVALAGTGLTAVSGQQVILNGSSSHDPDGDHLVYMWNQTGGPSVALHGADSPYSIFTAPDVQYLNTLTFSLVVHGGELYSREYITIVLIEPAKP